VDVRPIADTDRPTLASLADRLWGADVVVGHGVLFHPADLPGFLALDGDSVVGVLTYERVDGDTIEVVTIDALTRTRGVGTALLDAMAATATDLGVRRLVLTTTNDNVDALRFYQRRGFHLVALRPGELTRSRELKPRIPLVGEYGIPLTDELELVRDLV
jgi:ribosomal protein S18 acetylase RimI-like enzyme